MTSAIASQARKVGQPIARFEYERNLQLHGIAEVARYIAEPFGFAIGEDVQFTFQELMTGPLYYYYVNSKGRPPGFREHLERLVAGCHAAGAYDLDLHAMNVMVERKHVGRYFHRPARSGATPC